MTNSSLPNLCSFDETTCIDPDAFPLKLEGDLSSRLYRVDGLLHTLIMVSDGSEDPCPQVNTYCIQLLHNQVDEAIQLFQAYREKVAWLQVDPDREYSENFRLVKREV